MVVQAKAYSLKQEDWPFYALRDGQYGNEDYELDIHTDEPMNSTEQLQAEPLEVFPRVPENIGRRA